MKKKIILKRVFHRDKWRILVSFKYDESFTGMIRQINGSRYSDTYKAWYVDDNEETLKQVLVIFREKADVDISALTQNASKGILKAETLKAEILSTEILGTETPKLEVTTKASDQEIIPTSRIIEKVVDRKRFSPVEFRINEQDGDLAIKFTGQYDNEWIEEIRSFGRYHYDKVSKEFLLPWSVMTGDSLSDYFSSRGVEVKVVKTAPTAQ